MREIKFRGIDALTGKYVYGYYNSFLGNEDLPMIAIKAGGVAVMPDSVAQLIGVDVNGKEVYEGDMVVRIREWDDDAGGYVNVARFPMKATFDDYSAIANEEVIKATRRREV